jgi:hypothetical protein
LSPSSSTPFSSLLTSSSFDSWKMFFIHYHTILKQILVIYKIWKLATLCSGFRRHVPRNFWTLYRVKWKTENYVCNEKTACKLIQTWVLLVSLIGNLSKKKYRGIRSSILTNHSLFNVAALKTIKASGDATIFFFLFF